MGRPTKFCPEVADAILASIAQGNHIQTACAAAGVGTSTYREWLRSDRPEHVAFREAVRRIEAQFEAALVGFITTAARNDPYLAMRFLEKRWPERWGFKVRVDVHAMIEEEARSMVALFGLGDDDIAAIVAEAERILERYS